MERVFPFRLGGPLFLGGLNCIKGFLKHFFIICICVLLAFFQPRRLNAASGILVPAAAKIAVVVAAALIALIITRIVILILIRSDLS